MSIAEQKLVTFPEHLTSLLHILVLFGLFIWHLVKLHVFAFLVPRGEVRYDFLVNTMLSMSSSSFVLSWVRALLMLYVFIYAYWCPTRSPYQIMFVSLNTNMTGVTSWAGTASPSGAPEFIQCFVEFALLNLFFVFCVDYCLSLSFIYCVVSPSSLMNFHCIIGNPKLLLGIYFQI